MGSRVRIVNPNRRGRYIVPLCRKHYEEKREPLAVPDDLALVSADVCST